MNRLTIGSLKYGDKMSTILPKKEAKEDLIGKNDIIVVEQHGKTFQIKAKSKQLLLESVIEQQLNIDYKCKKGTCGRCRVKLIEGEQKIQPPNNVEKAKLKADVTEGFRLACQALVK